MKTFKIDKPKNTHYTDWVIQDGSCYAIFEYDDRKSVVFVCKTDKENALGAVKIRETKNLFYITI